MEGLLSTGPTPSSFSSVLKKNMHSHPMIYMRGIKAKDLVAIVDFIFHGEANIYQEDLAGFLAIAEELQLKGLEGDNTFGTEQQQNPKLSTSQRKQIPGQEGYPYKLQMSEESDNKIIEFFEDCLGVPVITSKFLAPLDANKEDLKA